MQITSSEIQAMRELMPDYTPGHRSNGSFRKAQWRHGKGFSRFMARVGLASSSGLPLDPAIATMIVLYILKIGVNIFCDYTEPPAASGGTLPPAP